jgi:hypothetical protein
MSKSNELFIARKSFNNLVAKCSNVLDFLLTVDSKSFTDECAKWIAELNYRDLETICDRIRKSEKHGFLIEKLWDCKALRENILYINAENPVCAMNYHIIEYDPAVICDIIKLYGDDTTKLILTAFHFKEMPDEYYRGIASGIFANRWFKYVEYIKKPIKIRVENQLPSKPSKVMMKFISDYFDQYSMITHIETIYRNIDKKARLELIIMLRDAAKKCTDTKTLQQIVEVHFRLLRM